MSNLITFLEEWHFVGHQWIGSQNQTRLSPHCSVHCTLCIIALVLHWYCIGIAWYCLVLQWYCMILDGIALYGVAWYFQSSEQEPPPWITWGTSNCTRCTRITTRTSIFVFFKLFSIPVFGIFGIWDSFLLFVTSEYQINFHSSNLKPPTTLNAPG